MAYIRGIYNTTFVPDPIDSYKRGPENSAIGTLSWNHSLKNNISSSSQAITINEAPLDLRSFFALKYCIFLICLKRLPL